MGRRSRGLSVRLKLTLSYAAAVVVAGALILATVWVFILRYVPDPTLAGRRPRVPGGTILITGPSRRALLDAFVPKIELVVVILLLFGLVGGWLLAGRMLTPLNRITDATRIVADGTYSHRIRLEGRRDELRDLADAFDTMLARLEAHVAEQQRFAANASHELRTPLAITQALLEVARKDPDRDAAELVERLHHVNARAIDLTEALLLLSRAEQRSFTRQHVDLSLVAEEAAETLLPLAEKLGVTIEAAGDVAPTMGSHALLLQLTTNLVHNAIVHNLPAHGAVWVTTSMQPDGVELRVENTGDQLTRSFVATLAEPFLRGTTRVRTDHAGVGLGLAIVERITDAHDGNLTLAPRATGGLSVTVQLPAAPATQRAGPLTGNRP
ncbi:MAG: HAMP domain-containing histidine kinase [Acidobacteria bacterium]|nr:HAMP domain-containing histidine kinase [Acidobacteriota bacterium]